MYATCVDGRGDGARLFCGSVSNHWGPVLRRSDDLGASWTEAKTAALGFPAGSDTALARIWQLRPGPADEPDVLYAGVEPAALFRSDDGGERFSLVDGLWNHPHRPEWQPGGGGLCLHTVLVHSDDPERLLIAISAAGIYRSDDGGGSWTPMTAIAGMDFGFPVVAHPSRPGTAYLLPLESDEYRCTPDGRCVVWQTKDGGGSWQPLTDGLPQDDAHLTVLRDGFTTDRSDPAGLYFGTRSGEVYGSIDDGATWRLLASHLPPVLSVRAAAVPAG